MTTEDARNLVGGILLDLAAPNTDAAMTRSFAVCLFLTIDLDRGRISSSGASDVSTFRFTMSSADASPAPGETPGGADDGLGSSAFATLGGSTGISGLASDNPLTGTSESDVGGGSARSLELPLCLVLA